MKLTATAGELASALALAASLIDSKIKVAALSAVHIKTADSAAIVSVNVLDFAVTTSVAAEIGQPGEVAVSASRLAALVASFRRLDTVAISTDSGACRVVSGRSRYRLATLPLVDLPPVPALGEEIGAVTLAVGRARDLFGRPAFAISRENSRHYLKGVFLNSARDGVEAVATDCHRLCQMTVAAEGALTPPAERGPIIPAPAVEIITRILRGADTESVILRRSKSLFVLEAAGITFTSKLIDETFPDYGRLMPAPSGNSVTVERWALVAAVERAAAVIEATSGCRAAVGLRWNGGKVLQVCDPDSDAVDDEIAAEVAGSGAVAIQIKYLAEALDELGSFRVRLDDGGDMQPMLITDPDNEDAP